MAFTQPDESTVLSVFQNLHRGYGFSLREPEGLVVPYFATEFNRCVEHEALNMIVRGALDQEISDGWFEYTPACRLNDMRKVESRKHLTVFEMLVSVGVFSPDESESAKLHITRTLIDFIVDNLGFERSRLIVTYFAGGEVVPNLCMEEDVFWRDAWLSVGLEENQVIPVRGIKNYALFVGEGERCGSKCEVMYNYKQGQDDAWIEIGTLIVDDSKFVRASHGSWETRPATRIVSGSAYGLERLVAAKNDTSDIFSTPLLYHLCEIVRARVGQSEITLSHLEGDILVLVDQMRACWFLMGHGVRPDTTPHGKILSLMLRRIRRKIAILCIEEWTNLISELVEVLAVEYARYPQIQVSPALLNERLNAVQWPEGWTPESYVGSNRAKLDATT